MAEPFREKQSNFRTKHHPQDPAKVLGLHGEILGRRKDGSTFPMELSVSAMRLGDRRLTILIVRDITEQKQAEADLCAARAASEAANQAKSNFLASMSHELRTPLNSVIGFSNILLKNKAKNLKDQDLTYLTRILDNGKHLLGLINQVLDLSKVEAGKMDLDLSSVDLGALVRETVAQLEGRVLGKEVKLLAHLPPDLVPVETDAGKLKQILINLVGNSLKFTEQGSVTVRVHADAEHRPVHVEVVDTGIGIPREKLGTIFEAFQQADTTTARQYGGTGLGLTISRAFCQLMGYRIEVDSQVGQGSTFRVVLKAPSGVGIPAPAGAGPGPEAAPGRASGEVEEPLPLPQGKLVLVIDDQFDSRTLLTHYLEDFGCRVITASSGEQALEIARQSRPDLITLDLLMPHMSGWNVLQQLKADTDLRDVPVIVVSIVAGEKRGATWGVLDILQKPVEPDEFLAAIRRNLAGERKKVLVVEDQEVTRRLLAFYLEHDGLETCLAADGCQALEKLHEASPDLIVLDLLMPEMDGFTFLRELRKEPRYLRLPVIVVTAKVPSAEEMGWLRGEATAVLHKGAELERDLRQVVQEVFHRRVGQVP
ncbi:MAG: response regulator [Planctomycetes bacterium]|nr:response regulator [Planctomycetota bacterium]